jgi:hypothetical protein
VATSTLPPLPAYKIDQVRRFEEFHITNTSAELSWFAAIFMVLC